MAVISVWLPMEIAIASVLSMSKATSLHPTPCYGIKLYLEEGSWILVRPSGTEPLMRVYMNQRPRTASPDS